MVLGHESPIYAGVPAARTYVLHHGRVRTPVGTRNRRIAGSQLAHRPSPPSPDDRNYAPHPVTRKRRGVFVGGRDRRRCEAGMQRGLESNAGSHQPLPPNKMNRLANVTKNFTHIYAPNGVTYNLLFLQDRVADISGFYYNDIGIVFFYSLSI